MSSVYWHQVPNESNSFSRLLVIGLMIIQRCLPSASAPGDNLHQVPLLPDPHQHYTRLFPEPNWSLPLGAFILWFCWATCNACNFTLHIHCSVCLTNSNGNSEVVVPMDSKKCPLSNSSKFPVGAEVIAKQGACIPRACWGVGHHRCPEQELTSPLTHKVNMFVRGDTKWSKHPNTVLHVNRSTC